MPLTSGTRLGHYEILAPIGAGGMGEVYRARDTKLSRDVAIKILPEAFAGDPDRMARFAREAQVLASLNHPNIAAIYGLEERALVMELVDGPMLSERIAEGALSVEEAMPILLQLIDALEYAHEKGIVHRDLKPANIKITPEGRIKVLDFGLAKALTGETAAADPASSPTLTMRATVAGVIMGTAGYMAPEQARGHSVDKRADIWSFGVVVYEMLTGRQLFGGATVSDTLASVLKDKPDWEAAPPQLRRLVRSCLAKDPRQRMRDIGDARLLMDEVPASPAAVRGSHWPWVGFATVSAVALAGVLLGVVHFREQPGEEPAPVRFQIPDPDSQPGSTRIALSPDGRTVAFTTRAVDGSIELWLRPLDSVDKRLRTKLDQNSPIIWSPDSRWIAVVADGKLKKMDAAGGPAQTLCNVRYTGVFGTWNREGVILFGSALAEGLFRIPQTGGDPSPVTTLAKGERAHSFPQFLPDGRHFIYLAISPNREESAVYLSSLDGKERKRLLVSRHAALYAPLQSRGGSGHLLFLRDEMLMAQALDSRSWELTGDAFPVAERVGAFLDYGWFSVSQSGGLAYRSKFTDGGSSQLVWFDRGGKELSVVATPGDYFNPTLSPDGKQVAVAKSGQNGMSDLWLIDLARATSRRFTTNPENDNLPVWSPDGGRIFFASNRAGSLNLYQRDSGGVESESLLLKSELASYPYSISADGRLLLYGVSDLISKLDLWVLPLEGEGKGQPVPFLKTAFAETQAQFSPKAFGPQSWVAYASNESGAFEVYLRPYPNGEPHLVSSGGGMQPKWRADGKELFYVSPTDALMAVEIEASPRLKLGSPRNLFPLGAVSGGRSQFSYAVAADGKRFLVNRVAVQASQQIPITVVTDWRATHK